MYPEALIILEAERLSLYPKLDPAVIPILQRKVGVQRRKLTFPRSQSIGTNSLGTRSPRPKCCDPIIVSCVETKRCNRRGGLQGS